MITKVHLEPYLTLKWHYSHYLMNNLQNIQCFLWYQYMLKFNNKIWVLQYELNH